MIFCHFGQFKGHSVPSFSNVQDEYEELLRYAVVTPKNDPSFPSQLLNTTQLTRNPQHTPKRDTPAQLLAGTYTACSTCLGDNKDVLVQIAGNSTWNHSTHSKEP